MENTSAGGKQSEQSMFYSLLLQDVQGALQEIMAKYTWRNRSIPWLLMPWFFLSPCYQQHWYWLCRVSENGNTLHRRLNIWDILLICTQPIIKENHHYMYIKFYPSQVPVTDWNGLKFNSLWTSDAIWRHRSGSTLAQVMACCLTAPSHYLHQCWLVISKVPLHPP